MPETSETIDSESTVQWPSLDVIGYSPDPNSEIVRQMTQAATRLRYSWWQSTEDRDEFTDEHEFELYEFDHPERTVWIFSGDWGQKAVSVHQERDEAESEYRGCVLDMLADSDPGGYTSVDADKWDLPEDELERISNLVDRLNNPTQE